VWFNCQKTPTRNQLTQPSQGKAPAHHASDANCDGCKQTYALSHAPSAATATATLPSTNFHMSSEQHLPASNNQVLHRNLWLKPSLHTGITRSCGSKHSAKLTFTTPHAAEVAPDPASHRPQHSCGDPLPQHSPCSYADHPQHYYARCCRGHLPHR
jgi:hypothetical protein